MFATSLLAFNFYISDLGQFLVSVIGIIVIAGLLYAFLRAVKAPEWWFTALYAVFLIIAMLLAVSFFFGHGVTASSSSGHTSVGAH